jgi:hypothetical protein
MVERPVGGDPLRARPTFAGLNRNRRSCCVDLRIDEGREVALRLAAASAVVIEGFRPGVADRLGVGFDAITAVNPTVLYISISGYREDGRFARRPGHDLSFQALASLLSRDDEGAPPMPRPPLTGFVTGLDAALGIALGLREVKRTGVGTRVDLESVHDPDHPQWGFAGVTRHWIDTPIIAAVNGLARGAGVEIALACDLVVADVDATLALPEVSRGLIAGAGGLIRLPRQTPIKRALELACTGDPIHAATALEWVIVNVLLESGEALTAAVRLAEWIAANAPVAVRERSGSSTRRPAMARTGRLTGMRTSGPQTARPPASYSRRPTRRSARAPSRRSGRRSGVDRDEMGDDVPHLTHGDAELAAGWHEPLRREEVHPHD